MEAQVIKSTTTKYGVTERKKAELDALNSEVLDAQNEVEQLQAIVDSLQDKANKYGGYLTSAEAYRDQTLANKNEMDALLSSAKDLRDSSDVAFNEMVLADAKVKELAKLVKTVVDELIYATEVINKLSNLVVRKKALNPLISDDLVDMVTQAGTDANNAVALIMVALKSTFTAQATSLESEAASALEYTEAMKLYETLTGTDMDGKKINALHDRCLSTLIDNAYESAEIKYESAKIADNEVLAELSTTQAKLAKAQVKLSSLQSGLAAANAAALAS